MCIDLSLKIAHSIIFFIYISTRNPQGGGDGDWQGGEDQIRKRKTSLFLAFPGFLDAIGTKILGNKVNSGMEMVMTRLNIWMNVTQTTTVAPPQKSNKQKTYGY